MAISLKEAEQVLLYGPTQDCTALMSAPGTGKSSFVCRVAKRAGMRYWPVYAPTFEVVDARGLPMVQHNPKHAAVQWAAPNCLPLAIDGDRYEGQQVAVNLDDLFQAPPPVQRAFVRAFYGDGRVRHVGDFELYPNVRFFITGNRECDFAGASRPDSYINDRITYLEVEPSASEWCSGAMSGFEMPSRDDGYVEMRAKVDAAVAQGVPDEIIAYVKWLSGGEDNPTAIYGFKPEDRSFKSPRSLERLGRYLRALEAADCATSAIVNEVVSGTIGEAEGVKFIAFRAMRDQLPDTGAVLKGEDVPLPRKPEVLFILATAVLRSAKKSHEKGVAKLINRVAEQKSAEGMRVGVEVATYILQECLRGDNKELRGVANLSAHPEIATFMQRNGKFFR